MDWFFYDNGVCHERVKQQLVSLLNPLNVKVAIYRNHSIDLLCKLIDWFVYDGNFGV